MPKVKIPEYQTSEFYELLERTIKNKPEGTKVIYRSAFKWKDDEDNILRWCWYFAANHTDIDSFNKRNEKGILFTVGDEMPTPALKPDHIETIFGYRPERQEFTAQDLYREVSRKYEVYHLIIAEGTHCQYSCGHTLEDVTNAWRKLIGRKALVLESWEDLPETIISVLEVEAGRDKDEIIDSWSGDTSLTVRSAIENLPQNNQNSQDQRLVEL
jgi:hypothetical protein